MEDFNMNSITEFLIPLIPRLKKQTKPVTSTLWFCHGKHHSFDPIITPTLPTPRNSTDDTQELQQTIQASLWDMWAMVLKIASYQETIQSSLAPPQPTVDLMPGNLESDPPNQTFRFLLWIGFFLPFFQTSTYSLLSVVDVIPSTLCSHVTTQGFDGIRAETFTLGCEGRFTSNDKPWGFTVILG